MKKSIINQFEEVLRNSFDCWKDIRIDRDDTDNFTTINIMNHEEISIYHAQMRSAMEIVDSFTIAFREDICLLIDLAEYDSKKVPVIKILISRE